MGDWAGGNSEVRALVLGESLFCSLDCISPQTRPSREWRGHGRGCPGNGERVKAGVMFTRGPQTGDRSVVTIEAAWGSGRPLSAARWTPDRFVVAKITGEISVREINDKHIQHLPAPNGGVGEFETPEEMRREPCLSDAEILALRDVARKIERHYGRPQDIEWAIDHSGRILLLQSRPETVWSAKQSAPVAKPAEHPMQHVMRIFGGRR